MWPFSSSLWRLISGSCCSRLWCFSSLLHMTSLPICWQCCHIQAHCRSNRHGCRQSCIHCSSLIFFCCSAVLSMTFTLSGVAVSVVNLIVVVVLIDVLAVIGVIVTIYTVQLVAFLVVDIVFQFLAFIICAVVMVDAIVVHVNGGLVFDVIVGVDVVLVAAFRESPFLTVNLFVPQVPWHFIDLMKSQQRA